MAKPERRPVNKYAFATAVLSTATPLFLGYDLATVSSTAVLAEADDLKLLACTVVLSSLLGALTAAGAQCLIGDRRTVLLSAAVLCAGALSRGLAEASFTGGVVVFVNGLGMGQALMIVPAYAAELSSLRGGIGGGVLTSHPDGFVYLGCILGSLCHSTGLFKLPARLAWRRTIASGAAIPALLSSAALLMPESPRWLVAQDELALARRVLSRTSSTLEEAELRLLEIKAELGLGGSEETQTPTRSRWKEECATWRELVARPTEPLRRAFVSALVAKVFQQASGIGSMSQYAQRAFRDVGISSSSSGRQMPRALLAFGLVVVVSFSIALILVELVWLLLLATAALACGGTSTRPRPRAASSRRVSRAGVGVGMSTRRQEQLKRSRGLSATMLLSLVALVWIALGPAQWAAEDASSKAAACCPRWLRAVNGAVSAAILSSFAWVYEATSVVIPVRGSLLLLVCPAVGVLAWVLFCACVLGASRRRRRG